MRLASSIYSSTICQSSKLWQDVVNELCVIAVNEAGAKGSRDFEPSPVEHFLIQYLCQRTNEVFGVRFCHINHMILLKLKKYVAL